MKKIIKIIILLFFVFNNALADSGNSFSVNRNTLLNTKNIEGIQSKTVSDLFSGAGVYSLNLEFPQGPKNINSNLSLSYNSYSTDAFTPYGYAWNLGISRINLNTKKGITNMYENNDFVVDGEELILENNDSGLYKSKDLNNLNEYYFEDNTWEILDTKGNRYYYGTDTNSKLYDPDNISKNYAWYIKKVVDNRWNEILYTYFKDNNQVYLDYVIYADGLYKIDFDYIDKSTSLTSYRTQFEIKTTKLLSNVILYVNNTESKRYTLDYDNIDSVFSHLISFKEVSGNNTLDNYEFEYGSGADIHLLKQINNNKGLEVNFEYKSSVFYKNEDGNNLNPNLPFNIRTLNKITYTDTILNKSNTEEFTYSGGAYYFDSDDLYGRQYAGFQKVTKIDSLGTKEVYYFHQGANSVDNPELGEYEDHISKIGKIYRKEIYDEDENLLKSEITKYTSEIEDDSWKVLKTRVTTNLYSNNDVVSSVLTYEYDDYSNLVEQINYGEVDLENEAGDFSDIGDDLVTYDFSYTNNVTKNLYGFISSQEVYDYDNNLSSKLVYNYDGLALGNISYGDITSKKTYVGTNDYTEQKYQYDDYGLVIKTIDGENNQTIYTYDDYNIYPISQTNDKGFVENYEYDYKVGKVSKYTNINGLETNYSYDNFGRLLSENVNINGTDYTKQSIVYDDISLPNSITQTTYFDINQNDSQETITYLNSFGSELETKKEFDNKYITNKTDYDLLGNKIFVSYSTFKSDSDYSTLDKNTEYGTSYEYDSLNRVIKISNESGNITYDYNNLDFTITNQNNIATSYSYDIFGNLEKVIEPGNIETNYSYNTNNQLIKIIDAEDNERSITYDLAGRRLSIEDLHYESDTNYGTRTYEYDDNSNITKYTTMSGDDIVCTYDELNRKITETYSGTTINYTYDSGSYANGLLTSYANGLLTSYTKGDYSENYSYDLFGNLISETKNYDSDLYIQNYTYNLAGQLLTKTYPDSKQLTYTYSNGITENINYDGTGLINDLEYNPALQILDLEYGNSAIEENVYDYENGYRLIGKSLEYNSNNYSQLSYNFDNLGNIINIQDTGSLQAFNKDVDYSYDDLNRLTKADYGSGEVYNYSYSDIGNITYNSRLGNYTYTDNGTNNPHAVTSVGTITYNYDDNGNVINDEKGSYLYNEKDELTSYTNNSGSLVEYSYNYSGIRIEKINGDLIDRYINKDYELNISGAGTGQIIETTKYIFLGSKKIATIQDDEIIYNFEDHLGGGNIDLSSTGAVLQAVDYRPYGSTREEYTEGNYENKYLFTGKEEDSESGLQYFEARYYDNELGRFRSIDRVFWNFNDEFFINPQLQNSYTYVGNNPLKYVDPSGESLKSVIKGVLEKVLIPVGTYFGQSNSSMTITYISNDVIKYRDNAAIMFTIINEEQSHQVPIGCEDPFGGNTLGLSQISLNPTQGDKDYFGFQSYKEEELLNIEKHLEIMNDRINTIKEKLIEEGKAITPENIGRVWNGGQNCVRNGGTCSNHAIEYGERIKENYDHYKNYSEIVDYNKQSNENN